MVRNSANFKERRGGGIHRLTHHQALLLRAALRDGKEAVDAWTEWYSEIDIEHLDDAPSQRLLPLVYSNLQVQATKVPGLDRVKGTYRYTWFKNQLLLKSAEACLNAFHDAGIETLVLKGLALISGYYEIGSRSMDDFDVLVHPDQAATAMRVLREAGWQSKEVSTPERLIPVWHAYGFRGGAILRGECDLHWHVLPETCLPGADEGFWDAAVPTRVGAVPTRTLNPTDQLLHVCVHGSTWHADEAGWQGTMPNVRGIADAITIMNVAARGDGIDWDRLTERAQKLRLTLPLREALSYLRDGWNAEVPPAALLRLYEAPVSHMERIEHGARTHPSTLLWRPLDHWTHHARLMGEADMAHTLIRFPGYLRQVWALERTWQVPFYAARALGRRAHSSATQRVH